jgi:hypothetical protein
MVANETASGPQPLGFAGVTPVPAALVARVRRVAVSTDGAEVIRTLEFDQR